MKRSLTAAAMISGLLLVWMARASGGGAADKPSAPDFTRGGQRDDSHDWTLGPTGARGWVYGAKGQTADARQILVTAVARGSPAEGVLASNDVLLGVSGRLFTGDARIQFARAIMEAEGTKGGGALRLTRWRNGVTQEVALHLAVLGSYADTAPYGCAKSERIFEAGCRAIATSGLAQVSIPNDLNALALLASGRAEYRPLLAEYARRVSAFRADSMQSWHYGYATLFLAEYVAATQDPAVTGGLRRLAFEIAQGQSAVGTWGHSFATPGGNCTGYGCMNQPGIVLTLALEIARKAGVHDPAVDRAIAKGSQFLRWYVKKGAIPYGDHQPWPGHEDNGKCSSAAVLFDLLGDREAAAFFAKMSTAAYAERERGHTGNFFNELWALPGVARCGPRAAGAYMEEQSWYYDLARGWDGRFAYQGSPAGEEEHNKYTKWDCTGAYLLAYALPLKSLYLTGKQPCAVPALSRREVDEVIAAGRDFFPVGGRSGYDTRETRQLLAGLSSWSPSVRKRSAQALGRREGDLVPKLLELLASSDRDTRYGACEALGCLGPRADAAAAPLRALLEDPDPWMQSLACTALPSLGPEVRKASVGDLLRMSVRANPADPRRMAQRAACQALFSPYPGSREPRSILAETLEGVDRKLLYPAVQSILENDDSVARGSLGRVYGKLTDRDLVELLPAIYKAIQQLAPSNEMFGDGIRLAGLDLLSRLHIREGLPLCVSVIELDRWGSGNRLPKCLEYIGRYGAHATQVLPQLHDMRQHLVSGGRGGNAAHVQLLEGCMAAIQASTNSPVLVGLQEFTADRVSAQTQASISERLIPGKIP
jgi:hypothetical protein